MTPEQYERLTELFLAAVGLAPDERARFLDQLSELEADSRRDLESLLASHDQGSLAETPPADIAAGLFQAEQDKSAAGDTPLPPNTRIDHYEICSLLGKGGMGEVYLAKDLRLHRKVALKILPAEFASNQDRMRRFEKEAQTAAALNHPNIAHIYEIGAAVGVKFIAMELVEGVTLRAKIHHERTELRTLLKYLQQVAEGLAKAHAAGIVHRDLKPDNIMITGDDQAKLLDFGLAKLIEQQDSTGIRSPIPSDIGAAVMVEHPSLAGTVMGTLGYMSPEQAQGKVDLIDHRSDIFSFGCILFEASTGHRPFGGDSIVKAIAQVANDRTPLIENFNPTAPSELQEIVQRCLAKDRLDRYQTILDVAIELKEVRLRMAEADESHTPTLSTDDGQTSRRRTTEQSGGSTSISAFVVSSLKEHKERAIVTALGAIAITTIFWFLPRRAAIKFNPTSQVVLKRLTPDIFAIDPTISPDGKYLAFVKSEKGLLSIWLKEMSTGNSVQTMPASVEGYGGLQFSPDGKEIYYMTHRQDSPNASIASVPVTGGIPQYVAQDVFGNFAMSRDGKHLAFVRGLKVVIASTEGKGERDLIELISGSDRFVTWGSQLSWSPDDSRIAICGTKHEYGRDHAELLEIAVSNGSMQAVPTPEWNWIDDTAWLADGASLLVTARINEGDSMQIWRVAYPGGGATRVTHDSNDYEGLSLAADSRTLVVEQKFSRQNIWIASLSDVKNARQLTSSTVAADGYSGIAFAPDDKIIFTSPRSGNVDLWKMNLDGSGQEQITSNAGSLNLSPRVTPDGRYIVFVSSRTGTKHIWRMDSDFGNLVQLTDGTDAEDSPYFSPDGQWVYYSTSSEMKPKTLKVSIDGGLPIRVSGDLITWDSVPSPDGKLLASGVYVDKSNFPWKVAITSSDGGEPLKLLDVAPFRDIKRWTNDSKSFIYIKGITAELWQQPIDGSPPTKLYSLSNERLYNFAISPDFQTIAYSVGNESSEAILIDNFSDNQTQKIR